MIEQYKIAARTRATQAWSRCVASPDKRPNVATERYRRIFVLSRPSETVWTPRQIFRFCAWLLSSLFGAPASWMDRTLNHMAAALTIRPLLTRLADVLEGRAGDCRGEAHLVASASTAAGPTPKPGRSSSCPGGMDTSRCSGRVTIACRAIHFTGNVPSPLTASPAETSSRERRSWRGRGARGYCHRLGPGQRAARGFGYGFPRTAAGPAVLPAPGFRATGRSRSFPDSAGRYNSEMSPDLGLPGAANPCQQKIR